MSMELIPNFVCSIDYKGRVTFYKAFRDLNKDNMYVDIYVDKAKGKICFCFKKNSNSTVKYIIRWNQAKNHISLPSYTYTMAGISLPKKGSKKYGIYPDKNHTWCIRLNEPI